ncbi:hypothetical protein V6N13_117954 [Hibiscus sabdariffa]
MSGKVEFSPCSSNPFLARNFLLLSVEMAKVSCGRLLKEEATSLISRLFEIFRVGHNLVLGIPIITPCFYHIVLNSSANPVEFRNIGAHP